MMHNLRFFQLAAIMLALFLGIQNSYSQVGIGTTSPHGSARLDIFANDKGLLIPRVNLNSINDITTIANPETSLLIYNTGSGGLSPSGFYFWNGSAWEQLSTSSSFPFQTLSYSDDSLKLSHSPSIYLGYADNDTLADNELQFLSFVGNDSIKISNGNAIYIGGLLNDTIVGNEITNVSDATLIRNGSGTNADPYTVDIATGGVTSSEIADSTIGGDKISTLSIQNLHIQDNAINSDKISNNAVGSDEIDVDAVGSDEIINESIKSEDIENGEVSTIDIADNAITIAKMADNSVDSLELVDNAVGTPQLKDVSVSADKIQENAVTTDKIINNAVTTD
ncbi:MAG: hypothetical protein N4A45_10775, partial [Flavobacteriales bacterium]|nr:hypothetical protein [Flavobacteriales bacterium]